MVGKPKNPDLRKSRSINVGLTEAQCETLVSEARDAGMSTGAYVRQLIQKRNISITHNIVLNSEKVVPLLRELSRIGNNINQIAHVFNTFKRNDDELSQRLCKQLVELHEVCSELTKVSGGVGNGCR